MGSSPGWSGPVLGGFVGHEDCRWDPPAIGGLMAMGPRPGADRGTVLSPSRHGDGSGWARPGGGWLTGRLADPAAGVDVALQGRAEFVGVFVVEVDLVGLTVEAEGDRLWPAREDRVTGGLVSATGSGRPCQGGWLSGSTGCGVQKVWSPASEKVSCCAGGEG